MTTILPSARPDIARATAEAWLREHGAPTLALVARRGYYRDTMGERGKNDIGIYDDAICLVTPTKLLTWNANTDPARLTPGMAVLVPGRYRYRVGTHNITKPKDRRYEALVQAGPVTLRRHGSTVLSTGWYGINIHRGGVNGTSSEGCQTIPPGQWPEFLGAVKAAMQAAEVDTIPYVLVARDDAV